MQRLIDQVGFLITYAITAIFTTLMVIISLFSNPQGAKTIAQDFKRFTIDFWR